jgi:tetratricopeptide (TPR) repeat protein
MIGYATAVRQFLFLLLLAAPASARKTSITPEMNALLHRGIDAIYRMDFDGADAACREAIALDPEYPHPYLGLAAVDLIRYSYGSEQSDPGLIAGVERKIAETIKVSERYLKKHPKDPDALFMLGSAHGILGRLAIVRRQWLKAFSHGRASMKSVRAAIKAEPELYDAYLGTGMFDYYVATIPKFAGWLAKVMLGGDRARGMRNIRIAAEKGEHAKVAAQLILVEIQTEDAFGGRDPADALRLMRDVRARYPESAMLHSALIVALYEDRRFEEALKETRDFQARVKAGKYPALNLAKGHALAGTVLWGAGDRETALREFLEGAEARGAVKTRWSLWSRVRAGQVLDALGRRGEALAAYRSALAEKDLWDYKSLVKPCLDAPCVGENYPGRFSPY